MAHNFGSPHNGANNGKKKDRLKKEVASRRLDPLPKGRGGIPVSDHAVVRFITRVLGDKAYSTTLENILPDETIKIIQDSGLADGTYPIHNMEFFVVLKNKVVVTIK
jgi:hypothetical protein|tara:strand:+ start:427 stop:747 length:321 start_codon:yes stop_codon:yes gene_type:complete